MSGEGKMVCFFAVWLALMLVGLFFCILGSVESLNAALAVLFLLATGFIALTVAVVRQILKLHHGAVRADSQPGKGSLFEVILPG